MGLIDIISEKTANYYYKNKSPCIECIVRAACSGWCDCEPMSKYNRKKNFIEAIVESIMEWSVIISFAVTAIFLLVLIFLGFIEFLEIV